MKFYKTVVRLISILLIIAFLTLIICVVGLNLGADDHEPAGFSVKKLTISDGKEGISMPWLRDPSERVEETDGEDIVEAEEAPDEALVPIAQFSGDLPRIVCWGDSLTESADRQTAYPDVLRKLSGAEVVNYGIRSDTTLMVAIRAGSVSVYTDAFIMPAETEPVEITVHTRSGKGVPLLRYADYGVNPCYINGVRGQLSLAEGAYYFTRSAVGDTIAVEGGSRITTAGMAGKSAEDVLVIFTGTNDAPDRNSIQDVISLQRGILDYTGCTKYVVVGLTCKKVMPDIEKVNEALAEEYGEHFLDIRSFMLQSGLSYEGLKATAEDKKDIENGEIPASLRTDYVHGNQYFYDILAHKLYEHLQYLGYLPL